MKNIWLDADPGHDDATAIMLAVNLPETNLLGVSTTHGNADSKCTAVNAARCLHAFGASPDKVKVFPGASVPLLLPAKHDPEIHGPDGLGGVDGLLDHSHPEVLAFFGRQPDGTPIRALDGMSAAIRASWDSGRGSKITVVSTGPTTNIALFISVYPDLVEAIEELVFMGGAVGTGNRSAVAEYNILCDPHAAQILLNVPVKKTMIPIDVTHTAIVTREIHAKLLSPAFVDSGSHAALPPASTPLRHTLSTVISFFAASYKSTFGFNDGPPLHDALTIAYVSNPSLFKSKRYRVDIELTGTHSIGQTVVDVWKYQSCDDSWGRSGLNCIVTESLDVKAFFDLLLQAISRCDERSPLNKPV